MNARTLAALVLVNVVLLAALIVTTFPATPAHAQLGGGGAQYIMVAGTAVGLPQQDVVYVVNTTDGRVVSLAYDSGVNEFRWRSARDLARDLRGAGGQR